MERLQGALEKFKQQQRQQSAAPKGGQPYPANLVPPPIVYTRTRSIEVPESLLREHRIVAGFEKGPFVDSYKVLRTQVMHRLREHGWNVLAVTSPCEGEGKTLTAINLAVSLAMDTRQTVLLIDADLRRPSIHEIFGLEECQGLADYLLDDVPVEDTLVHPGIGRFVLMPGGRCLPNSVEVLTSHKMIGLVEELKQRYPSRVILFDLPPLLMSADVLAFAPYTDALLLIVEEGKTTVPEIEQAMQLLSGAVPVLGTVLNKARSPGEGSSYSSKRALSY